MNRNKIIMLIACLISFYSLSDWTQASENSVKQDGCVAEYQPRRIPRSLKFKRMGYRYARLSHTQDQALA